MSVCQYSLMLALVSMLSVCLAQEPPTEGKHSPPPEAFTACAGKSAGQTASFTAPHGDNVNGICQTDSNGKLVLRPDRPNEAGKPHREPPPEAYAACANKTAGSKSQLLTPRGETLTGICEPVGDKLVLRPDNIKPFKQHE